MNELTTKELILLVRALEQFDSTPAEVQKAEALAAKLEGEIDWRSNSGNIDLEDIPFESPLRDIHLS